MNMFFNQFSGIFYLLCAEILFTLATVFAKFAKTVPAHELVFLRFFLGLFIVGWLVRREKISLIPNNWSLIIQRGIYNTLAVLLFFWSVQKTTLTNANMLNMTYPLFIFLIAPFINPEKTPRILFAFLLTALAGIYLVIKPDFSAVNIGDLVALLSGLAAAFGVITLRKARSYDSTALIVFYLMLIGSIISSIFLFYSSVIPQGQQLIFAIASALCGVFGQVFITMGYRYITAQAGSLVSTSRIAFAFIFGSILFQEIWTLRSGIGAGLIIFSLLSVTLLHDHKKT